MILRPVDASGDILPVLSSSALLRGAPAIARLVQDRLELLTGDWWENTAWGNSIIDLMKDTRFTEADTQAMATYLTSYIRQTNGVQEVRDVVFSAAGRRFSYSCTVETDTGEAGIRYSI